MIRPDMFSYFMSLAELTATRSTCIRRQVGAVAIQGGHIVATGYNGAPTKIEHCIDTGCLREQLDVPSGEKHELCRGVHAEQNVICQAAKLGARLEGATLFCTHQPCSICAKMIVNAGFVSVVYKHGYPDETTCKYLGNMLVKYKKVNI